MPTTAEVATSAVGPSRTCTKATATTTSGNSPAICRAAPSGSGDSDEVPARAGEGLRRHATSTTGPPITSGGNTYRGRAAARAGFRTAHAMATRSAMTAHAPITPAASATRGASSARLSRGNVRLTDVDEMMPPIRPDTELAHRGVSCGVSAAAVGLLGCRAGILVLPATSSLALPL